MHCTICDKMLNDYESTRKTLDGKAPRVFMYHDSSQPVGIVSERVSTSEAMLASMYISRTSAGDDALTLSADGVMEVSVGVNPREFSYDDQGRMIVTAADWMELSLVPIAAFEGSTILVAGSYSKDLSVSGCKCFEGPSTLALANYVGTVKG